MLLVKKVMLMVAISHINNLSSLNLSRKFLLNFVDSNFYNACLDLHTFIICMFVWFLYLVWQASENSWSLVSRCIQIKYILLFFRNFCHVNYGLLRALDLPVCSDTDETVYQNPAQHFLYESLKVYNSIHFLK